MNRPIVLAFAALLALPAAAQTTKNTGQATQNAGPVPAFGNSKEPIQIDADKLEVFSKEQRAVYSGNVIAVQGETTIKSATMIVFYERENSNAAQAGEASKADATTEAAAAAAPSGGTQLKRVEAKGGVTVISKDQVATGNEGVFDRSANKIILTGNVALTQGENVTKGEKLVYDTVSGVAVVESGPSAGRVRGVFVPGDDTNPQGSKSGSQAKPKTPAPKT
jgi:lipopolysaccharide export system protein LptA